MTDGVSSLENMNSVSILRDLRQREFNTWNHYRKDILIMRKLVCSKSVKYESMWTRQSRMPIYYENRMLLMSGYRDYFTVKGMDRTVPVMRKFSLPKGRVLEVLWCQYSLIDFSEHRVHCVTLMADNSLHLLDYEAGRILRVIPLGVTNKYLHIDWNSPCLTFFLKTKLFPKKELSDRLTSFAVFRIFPVALMATMDINRSIFGSNITDASLFADMLYVTNSSGDVRLYALDAILEKVHFESCVDASYQPRPIVLTESPPVLFDVQNAKSDFQVGGVPWTYIIPSSATRSCFEVRSLANGEVLRDGKLDFKYANGVDPDVAYFHPDDSGRILHSCLYNFTVKRVLNEEQLSDDFCIKVSGNRTDENAVKRTSVTSSGRVVKIPASSCWRDTCDKEKIVTHCYEDELDILALLRCDSNGRGWVTLHDNQTGKVLKTIHLTQKISDLSDHTLVLDMDILVVLTSDLDPGKHLCHLYCLQLLESD